MSILSTLLTGGTLVGKICQSLTSALTATDNETGITVSLSSLNIGGVKFMRSNASSNDGSMQTYVFNSNTSGIQSVAFPNIGEGGSASMTLGPTEKQSIDNFLTENVSPDTNVVIGPATDTVSVSNDNPLLNGAIRLIARGIQFGRNFLIDRINITITNDALLIVVTGTTAIAGLGLLILRQNGIQVIDGQNRQAYLQLGASEDEESTTYKIDLQLDQYPIQEENPIEELILTLNVKNINTLADAQNNTQLHPIEIKLLQQIENQIKSESK